MSVDPMRAGLAFGLALLASLACHLPPALAQGADPAPITRAVPAAGAIVAAKGGEELQFPREPAWRPAVVRQDVVGGDTLRTGEIGTLGILFADQTTIRVGRQSTLVVNKVASGASPTELELPAGNVWARASRGGTSVTVKTPAAAAAIRGTDWSLSVQGDRTSLIVLEGVVDFSNPQGSVTVRQGEGASARIGEAPTKIVLVRPKDREQMLFYLELRGLFRSLPASSLEGPAARAERARLQAIAPAARTVEEAVRAAEAAVSYDTAAEIGRLLADARGRALKPAQRARLDLVEAMTAGKARRYAQAERLFASAMRGTTGRQRTIAQCGHYAAATLANPKRVLPQPRAGGAEQTVCAAYVTGFAKTLEEAAGVIKRNEAAHPRHVLSNLLSAQVALLLDRREDMRAAVSRMQATDPDAPETLLASGYLKGSVESDIEGAVRDLARGAAAAPGNSTLWNGLALAQGERDAPIEAEFAFRKAIEADPDDPVPYANLAIELLDQNRVEEAGALIEKALVLDPSLYVAYTAKGRYLLQKGDIKKALEFLLAGTASNPAYAQGLLAVAIAQYMSGDRDVSAQALDNADRLDPNDPVTAIARTAIAIDRLEADSAIRNAREAVRRYRSRGGYFATLNATRTGGSYLGSAYQLLGLNEWGRFYTDRVADPFSATGYFDLSSAQRGRPFFARPTFSQLLGGDTASGASSLAIQGLLLDPLAVSGRVKQLDLFRRPFIDAEIGGSLVSAKGRAGWQSDVSVQAYSNEPVPVSVSLTAGRVHTADRRGRLPGGEDTASASAMVGIAPSAADRFLLIGTLNAATPSLLSPALNVFDADRHDVRSYQIGGGWSHTFGHRHVLSVAATNSQATDTQRRIEAVGGLLPIPVPPFGTFDLPGVVETRRRADATVSSTHATLSHMIGWGDFTLRSGIEGQLGRIKGVRGSASRVGVDLLGEQFIVDPSLLGLTERDETRSRASFRAGRAYTNLLWQPSDFIQLEAGFQAVVTDVTAARAKESGDPRLGIGVSPFAGHWLRAAWRKDAELPNSTTLSPITTVGLVPNVLPTSLGARVETKALRWDAEWSPHLFTSVEYQRQEARKLSIGMYDTLDSYEVARGRVNYLSASANIWLTHGIGVFATVAGADSATIDAGGIERRLPYIPRRFARAGIVFVHPSRIKFSVIQNVIGARDDAVGGRRLDGFTTTDVLASWETPDRSLQLGFGVLNLFDRRYELIAARATSEAIAGTGRTIAGSIRARF